MRIFFTVIVFIALVLSGCVAGQKTIGSYQGARQSPGHDQSVAHSARPGVKTSDQTSYARDVLMPVLIRVNARISSYDRKVKAWQEDVEQPEQVSRCRQQALDLRAEYRKLHDQLLKDQPEAKSRLLIRNTYFNLEKKDIAYLEGHCAKLSDGSAAFFRQYPAAGMDSLENALASALANGQYEQVIHDFQSLQFSPGEQPGYGVSFIYGLALLKSGRDQEARRIFSDQLSRIQSGKQGQTEFTLLRLLADLDFGTGDYRAARSRYEEFQQLYERLGEHNDWAGQQLAILQQADFHREEIRAYAALLFGYLSYNPQRDGFIIVQQARAFERKYPMSMAGASAAEVAQKAGEDAEKWFAGLLAQVDQLSSRQRRQEALLLLERVPADILPLDKQAIVRLKKNALLTTSQPVRGTVGDSIHEEILKTINAPSGAIDVDKAFEFEQEDYVPVTALADIWEQSMANMQAKEYDQAIKNFSELLNTSYGTKAQLQIEEASRLAAQDARKKAAVLFVRANNTTDPEIRKQLLLSSKTLLEEILQKYPRAGLEDKVKRNLDRIDQELADFTLTDVPSSVKDGNRAVETQRAPAYQSH